MANDALRQLLIMPLQKREAVVQVIVVVLSFRHLDHWGTQIAEQKHILNANVKHYIYHTCDLRFRRHINL